MKAEGVKHTKDFFQMAFIDIPAEFFYVQNKRLSYRRRFPEISQRNQHSNS
jgi:hypothetical protein